MKQRLLNLALIVLILAPSLAETQSMPTGLPHDYCYNIIKDHIYYYYKCANCNTSNFSNPLSSSGKGNDIYIVFSIVFPFYIPAVATAHIKMYQLEEVADLIREAPAGTGALLLEVTGDVRNQISENTSSGAPQVSIAEVAAVINEFTENGTICRDFPTISEIVPLIVERIQRKK